MPLKSIDTMNQTIGSMNAVEINRYNESIDD